MLLSFVSGSGATANDSTNQAVDERLRQLTQLLTQAERQNDLNAFLQRYDEHAICMPEYQLTLQGLQNIRTFYEGIFQRQHVKTLNRQPLEFIHIGKTIVEIGTFNKEYTGSKSDTIHFLRGKYWHIWESSGNGNFKLKGEAFGFFHSVKHPETFIIQGSKEQPDESDIILKKEIPFELKAYNALMEKGVRNRDGILRSEFFTADAVIYPFADTVVAGIDKIKPYLIAYCSRGTVTIDSIMCYTYDFENAGDYILEYDMFKVKWRPDAAGRTEGKGIRIWKRQPDNSLRLYREIGTHNYLN